MFGRTDPRDALRPLYAAIVAEARDPAWYARGGAPDTLDGRFDMVAAVLALVLLRLDAEGEPGAEPAARLAELFVEDMDAQLRERGIGDIVVGKHVGRMMSALGGRLGAYRDALGEDGDLPGALVRNLWRGEPPGAARIDEVAARLRGLHATLAATPAAAVLAGRVVA